MPDLPVPPPLTPTPSVSMTLAEAMARPIPPGRLRETVTYMECHQPPEQPQPPLPPGVTLARHAGTLTWADFGPLFHAVGDPWLWRDRLLWPREAIDAHMADPGIVIHLLARDGQPLGFCEMDRRDPADGVSVLYFGLVPRAIGGGLGRALFIHALADAWAESPACVRLNTCTHDSPRALAFYQAYGFAVVDRRVTEADDPRLTGILPAEAGARFPLAPLITRPPALSTA
ncbi:GNAT family N-acetyltransferase [Roseospira visakhapatnamensis]|uniref:N-acetyltransferase domain-containing protein n=1 Tax=Roseospira visakhapatnamensis TaxID=390880 RepID=A0A7W6RAT0_9PROT|nr:GNAT family N-acetyltransferase [Roseospira visakhapatnamensis]MBB4264912.1 hypothetical protein [Roseospira visakhapatnamensis]